MNKRILVFVLAITLWGIVGATYFYFNDPLILAIFSGVGVTAIAEWVVPK